MKPSRHKSVLVPRSNACNTRWNKGARSQRSSQVLIRDFFSNRLQLQSLLFLPFVPFLLFMFPAFQKPSSDAMTQLL